MPFIGRDWRSPGEAWVKTESLGWQRMKIIESQLYPSSACHQNPACSWPPRSEFGQHMANNCNRNEPNRNGRNSSEFRESISSTGSTDSGRGGSMSPSPTGSPEKNVHHLHPLIISSPYGQYSCCPHHFEAGWSPKTNNNCNNCCELMKHDNNCVRSNAQSMSRSLSRESVCTNDPNMASIKMRYNNSVGDFRNSSASPSSSSPIQDPSSNSSENPSSRNLENNNHNQQQAANIDCSNFASPCTPKLMKNGLKIADTELPGSSEPLDSYSVQNNMVDAKTKNQQHQQNQSQNNNLTTSSHPAGTCCCSTNQGFCHPKEPIARTAPHCRISVRTREVAMYNTISEAFYRLDFCNAIHDIRRFNYICKLLHLLITQNLTSLSGCATKVLFTMLEQVAWEVSSNKRNIHVLKNLLNELRQIIQKYYCWGRPIGSSLLWQQHFDTIERISQIVDGIELSPPKNDSGQATFNNLPVEMIREILLRLNDYRDLVNSAQASPVMRSMIDNQTIWQQLCRYHFTEQQLKLALDDTKGLLAKKSNSRGVKYARTSSADGRTSFRNPVAHRSKSVSTSTTRQQIEQTSGRRGSRQLDKNNSYVTKAIRIFDKEVSSTTLGSTKVRNMGPDETKRDGRILNDDSNYLSQNSRSSEGTGSQQSRISNSSRPSHEIDWERVFHQLRKKFDLKEEYADCLLLCRHCRCLFWKSFGHPCIKNDDSPRDKSCSNIRFDQSCSDGAGRSNSTQNVCNCDGLNRQSEIASQGQGDLRQQQWQQNGENQARSRVSVAALSRNFDNRAQGIRQADNVENVPPESNAPSSQNGTQQRPPSQRPLDNGNSALEARLRERNARAANRVLEGRGNNNNNNNGNNAPARAMRRDELVPKHVAISPQAFLKFFSL